MEIKKIQMNVIRTNCVDCLDRTNVVQTLLGRWAIIGQLKELYPNMASVEDCPDDSLSLPDEVSELYVGCGLSCV